MADRGYASDTAVRKSSRKREKQATLSFDFVNGESYLTPGGSDEDLKAAMRKGRANIVAAVHLDQAHMTRAVEMSDTVAVELHSDWQLMSQETIAANISGESVRYAFNPAKVFFREKHQAANNDRVQKGKSRSVSIKGMVHFTFAHQLPEIFNIALAGTEFVWTGPIPRGLDAIGVQTTSKNEISVTVDPEDIVFMEGKTFTEWKNPHAMKIVFLNLAIPADQLNQVKFRFRVAAAAAAQDEFRLRMEMMVLPQGVTLDAINPILRENLNSFAFPAIPINLRTSPIKWENDEERAGHHMFTVPTIFVKNPENFWMDPADNEADAPEDRMPHLDSACVARLAWEVEKQMKGGCYAANHSAAQKAFWKKIEKTPNFSPSYTLPLLRIAAQKKKKDGSQQPSGGETSQDELEEDMDLFENPTSAEEEIDQEEVSTALEERRAEKKGSQATSSASQVGQALGGSRYMVSHDHWDDPQYEDDQLSTRMILASRPPNRDKADPPKGKSPLFRNVLLVGSKYEITRQPPPVALGNLAANLPRATATDLDSIHRALQSSLAPSSLKSVMSAKRAFTRVWGSELWLHDPKPGDREILLTRLMSEGRVKLVSALQYLKAYGTILALEGQTAPPPTKVFDRVVSGLKKRKVDPVEDILQKQRKAHSIASLRIAAGAFHHMEKTGSWAKFKTQTWFTILLTAFWGRFRMGELLARTQEIFIKETLLKLDLDILTDKDGKEFARIWLRREKAQAARGGSMVELPKLPAELKDVCPIRALKRYLKLADQVGLTDFDPLFTAVEGNAVTSAQFEAGVKEAVAAFIPDDQDLFVDISNHSCRSGVPTMAQETDLFIPEDVLRNLGRWSSSAALLYLKSFEAAMKARRFIEDEIVKKLGGQKVSGNKLGKLSDQPPPAKKKKLGPHLFRRAS